MIIFAFPAFRSLAKKFIWQSPHRLGAFTVARYASDELYLELKTNVVDEDCLIIGETAPPDSNLLTVLMLADTLKQAGAAKVRFFSPYLGYSRQEHQIANVARNTYLVGRLLKSAGVDQLITIDLHNLETKKDFPIKLVNLPAQAIFEPILTKLAKQPITLLAPDQGAVKRCQSLHTNWPLAYFEKQRLGKSIKLKHLSGELNQQVLIYDDILSTGETLVQAVKQLRRFGVNEITILVSHGQFRTNTWRQLLKQPNTRIYTSDTCPEAQAQAGRQIKVLSCLPALRQYFKD